VSTIAKLVEGALIYARAMRRLEPNERLEEHDLLPLLHAAKAYGDAHDEAFGAARLRHGTASEHCVVELPTVRAYVPCRLRRVKCST
jgi:hypothetical protein